MAKKKRYYEAYAGIDERRRQEYEDSMMIKEDRSALANLPQQVIMKEYPKTPYNYNEGLDDTFKGVKEQMKQDLNNKKLKKGPYPEKY